jgi:prepilin-type N-terminal cleavage/methylation domain-containing protein
MASRARSGFSLIEIMIALVIISIALSAFCSSLFTAQQVQTRTVCQSLALEQIQKVVEQIQYTDYDGVPPGWDKASLPVTGLTPQAGQANPCTVNVFNQQVDRIPLRITVAWTDLEGPASISVVYVHVKRGG